MLVRTCAPCLTLASMYTLTECTFVHVIVALGSELFNLCVLQTTWVYQRSPITWSCLTFELYGTRTVPVLYRP